jgi:hypothetical protein
MHRLAATLPANAISVVQFVPTEMRMILDEAQMCSARACATCCAAARPWTVTWRWPSGALAGRAAGQLLWPDRGQVDSAWYEVGEQVPERALVPIGRPVDNAQLYVLDAHAAPTGERARRVVWAAWAWARLSQPARTHGAFRPIPSGPAAASIAPVIWRDGWTQAWSNSSARRPAGQVRGFGSNWARSRPLHACGGVSLCAVLLREDVPGQRELVAYVTSSMTGTDAQGLRAQRAKLPEHMVPARRVFLPQLPRLANGKVDRRKPAA